MTLLFDLDGTLIDVQAKYYRVYCSFVELHAGLALPIEEFWELKRAAGSDQEILRASNLGNMANSAMRDFVTENIEQEDALHLDQPFAEAQQTLAELSRKHDCYLISMRRNRELLQQQVAWLGLSHYFKTIINPDSSVAQIDRLTTTPKARALKSLSLSQPALIVGDSDMDIVTGKQMGSITCAVTTGLRNESVLRSYYPDFIISSIAELHDVVARVG
jgi:phosphoglycolate phosphatase-like HAD superfamily hydrolase